MGTCGKKNYMSPEIFANKANFDGFAVDLWSAVSTFVWHELSPNLTCFTDDQFLFILSLLL
jgi:hypothetical protein